MNTSGSGPMKHSVTHRPTISSFRQCFGWILTGELSRTQIMKMIIVLISLSRPGP